MEDSSEKLETGAAEVIEAVLGGQRERYRDLVDRHADKVYAVAWSRLGDRHLAEEVVQETFIQGYQRLNQLKDPSKFLTWIVRIARNTAINLGIRHRNELKKRRRWAFEQPSPAEDVTVRIKCSHLILRNFFVSNHFPFFHHQISAIYIGYHTKSNHPMDLTNPRCATPGLG